MPAPVALITGCSTGIGHDLAVRLSQAGYRVVATARRIEALNDLNAALKLSLDVEQTDSVGAAVAATMEAFGRIDVLVNNAGFVRWPAVMPSRPGAHTAPPSSPSRR